MLTKAFTYSHLAMRDPVCIVHVQVKKKLGSNSFAKEGMFLLHKCYSLPCIVQKHNGAKKILKSANCLYVSELESISVYLLKL